jgi:hypothetical protein
MSPRSIAAMKTHSGMPEGLPLLGRGKHNAPGEGACFMELASVLAGERFSDHPRCTHSLLAELARRVNDAVSDHARQRLLPLVSEVVGLRGKTSAISAEIVITATRLALAGDPENIALSQAHSKAERRLDAWGMGAAVRRITELGYRHGAGYRAVVASVSSIARNQPASLPTVLVETIHAARRVLASDDSGKQGLEHEWSETPGAPQA